MGNSALCPKADIKVTETFLQVQEGVLDASVWFQDGDLVAHVVLHGSADWNPENLHSACLIELGENATPRAITVMKADRRRG